jgi:hypothetical protein
MEATSKDVKIGEFTYQLGRFNARDGSWLVGQFLTRGLLYALEPQENGKQMDEKELAGMLAITLRTFNEADYEKVRMKALGVCRRYEDRGVGSNAPIPIFMADGVRYAVSPEPDLVDLTMLMLSSLSFNLHCFFAPGSLEKLLTVFPGSQSTPGLTAISSDQ